MKLPVCLVFNQICAQLLNFSCYFWVLLFASRSARKKQTFNDTLPWPTNKQKSYNFRRPKGKNPLLRLVSECGMGPGSINNLRWFGRNVWKQLYPSKVIAFFAAPFCLINLHAFDLFERNDCDSLKLKYRTILYLFILIKKSGTHHFINRG